MKKAYLFLNGELLGRKDFYKNIINEEKGDIYCADGGAKNLEQLNIFPKELWGDLDSVDGKVLEKYRNNGVEIRKFPKDKNFTDGELILQYLSSKNYDKIIVIGGLGGRKDHELTNLNLMFKFENLEFLTESERIFPIKNILILSGIKGKTISFIPFSDRVTKLNLIGFKYPLKDYELHQGDSICMSNVAMSDICKISFENGKLMGIVIA